MYITHGDRHRRSYRNIYLELLRPIKVHSNLIQRQLSKALGASLGKTKYCLKTLKEKGRMKWVSFTQYHNTHAYLGIPTQKKGGGE